MERGTINKTLENRCRWEALWVKDVLIGQVMRVRVGKNYSGNYEIENGTTHGKYYQLVIFSNG